MICSDIDSIRILEEIRWPHGARCPYCRSARCSPVAEEGRHHCNACNASFSVLVGTIFHRTHSPLRGWFRAVEVMLKEQPGATVRELATHAGVSTNTAARMGRNIRAAMKNQTEREMLRSISNLNSRQEQNGKADS